MNQSRKPSQKGHKKLQMNFNNLVENNFELQAEAFRAPQESTIRNSKSDFNDNQVMSRNQTQSSKDLVKCSSKKFGLKQEPLCNKKNHEKGKIKFLCLAPQCSGDKRFACANCVLTLHHDHVSYKLPVASCQEKYEQSFKKFSLLLGQLEDMEQAFRLPTIQKKIVEEIEEVQQNIHQFLDELKEKILIQITEFSQICQKDTISFIQDQKLNYKRLSEILAKNMFDLSPSELETTISLIKQEGFQHIYEVLEKSGREQKQYEDLSMTQWTIYKSRIESNSEEFFKSCQTFFLNDSFIKIINSQQTYETEQTKLTERLRSPRSQDEIQPMNITISSSAKQNQVQPYDSGGTPLKSSEQFKKQLSVISFANCPDGDAKDIKLSQVNKKALELSPQSFSNAQMKNYISNDSHKSNGGHHDHYGSQKSSPIRVNKSIEVFNRGSVSNGVNIDLSIHHSRSNSLIHRYPQSQDRSTTFPYRRYLNPCHHQQITNTVAIFKCCNQAYLCIQCHDLLQNHKGIISNPSMRYCMRCLEIFQIGLPTTTIFNCTKCKY